MHFVGALKT